MVTSPGLQVLDDQLAELKTDGLWTHLSTLVEDPWQLSAAGSGPSGFKGWKNMIVSASAWDAMPGCASHSWYFELKLKQKIQSPLRRLISFGMLVTGPPLRRSTTSKCISSKDLFFKRKMQPPRSFTQTYAAHVLPWPFYVLFQR